MDEHQQQLRLMHGRQVVGTQEQHGLLHGTQQQVVEHVEVPSDYEPELQRLSNSGVLRGPDGQALHFIAVFRNGQHEYIDHTMLSPEYINIQISNGIQMNIATTSQTIAAAQHNQEQLLEQTTIIDERYILHDMMNQPKEVVQLGHSSPTQFENPLSDIVETEQPTTTSSQMPDLAPIPQLIGRSINPESFQAEYIDDEEEEASPPPKSKKRAAPASNTLPHKKRIRKPAPAKKAKPTETDKKQSVLVIKKTGGTSEPSLEYETYFTCEICMATCGTQLEFFRHLKLHYEPTTLVQPLPVASAVVDPLPFSAPRSKRNRKPTKRALEAIEEKQTVASARINKDVDPPQSVQELLDQFPGESQDASEEILDDHVDDDSVKDSDYQPDDDRDQPDDDGDQPNDDGDQADDRLNEFSDPDEALEHIRDAVDKDDFFDSSDLQASIIAEGESSQDSVVSTDYGVIREEMAKPVVKKCVKSLPTEASKLEYIEERDDTIKVGKRGNAKRSFICTVCEKVCNSKNSLHYHFLSHTGERPHQCTECGKGFMAHSALKVHMRLHTGDKPYSCEICKRPFRQWGDLKYHMTSLHSEQKNHQCEFCGKDFARRYSLVLHRRIHTGEQNYKCEFCPKTFRASTYLQDHRRIHTGEKPHVCEFCNKKFRVRGDLKRHWNIHVRANHKTPDGGSGTPSTFGPAKTAAKTAATATTTKSESDLDDVAAAIQIIDDGKGGFTVKNEEESPQLTLINGIMVDTAELAKRAIKRSKPKPRAPKVQKD